MKLPIAIACAVLVSGCAGMGEIDGTRLRVISDRAIGGFKFPESVGCDAKEKALYVSNFGGTELKPAEKDQLGYITKIATDGSMLEGRFLPRGPEKLNKPKGLWIEGSRLWVTDIDSVWVYDLKTRLGRKLPLPGVQFANDPAVRDGVLYVTDNRSDQVFRVEPADFLASSVTPKVTSIASGKGMNPNGVWPSRDGTLLMAGFLSAEQARAIYSMTREGEVKALSQPIGRLDGIYEMADGTILATDWNTGSLFRWTAKGGVEKLAGDFKGPADFCVIKEVDGYTVFAPDLVKSEVRIIRLGP
jgi:sugar lactone lactonase YvrE